MYNSCFSAALQCGCIATPKRNNTDISYSRHEILNHITWTWEFIQCICVTSMHIPYTFYTFCKTNASASYIDMVSEVHDCAYFNIKLMVKVNKSYCGWYIPDIKVHGANMGPILGRQDPGGPHVGPMDLAIWYLAVFALNNVYNVRTRCISPSVDHLLMPMWKIASSSVLTKYRRLYCTYIYMFKHRVRTWWNTPSIALCPDLTTNNG